MNIIGISSAALWRQVLLETYSNGEKGMMAIQFTR